MNLFSALNNRDDNTAVLKTGSAQSNRGMTTMASNTHVKDSLGWWLPGAGGRLKGEFLLNGYRVSDLQDERVMGMDGNDGCKQCECIQYQ